MENILNTPLLWNILTVVFAALAIIVMLILFRYNRKKKMFSYKIISNSRILTSHNVPGKLEILFNGKPVKDAYLSYINLINSGNIEIKKEDFYEPISINFGKDANILATEIVRGIQTVLVIEKGKIIVEPTLYNKNEDSMIMALIDNFKDEKIEIDGRITGAEISEYKYKTMNPFSWVFSTLFFFFGVSILGAYQNDLAFMILGLIMIIIGGFYLVSNIIAFIFLDLLRPF